jgi:multidrug efflux pump subunit AcrA (membrane-fusion protein)
MLELLHERDAIQAEARIELRNKFREFDIECVDVLIGKPGTEEAGGKIETLLEQLRLRQLSIEQLETYERQRAAAEKLRTLNEAQAQAEVQTKLTQAEAQVRIAESAGSADLARARKQAEQAVVGAEAELNRSRKQAEQTIVAADAELARSKRQAEQTVLIAEAEAKKQVLAGKGEGQKAMQIGLAEATVLLKKAAAFGDPRLYALSVVAERLAHSTQPLVPERVFVNGGEKGGQTGLVGMLLDLLVAEKSGFAPQGPDDPVGLKEYGERMSKEALEALANGASK